MVSWISREQFRMIGRESDCRRASGRLPAQSRQLAEVYYHRQSKQIKVFPCRCVEYVRRNIGPAKAKVRLLPFPNLATLITAVLF